MTTSAVYRMMVAAGIVTALVGMYIASQTSAEFRWDSAVSIAVIVVGVFMAVIGLMYVVGSHEPAGVEIADTSSLQERPLPDASLPLVYGAFVVTVSVIAGLVAGHYLGRDAGFLTFIFGFIVANLLFGLPLALTTSNK